MLEQRIELMLRVEGKEDEKKLGCEGLLKIVVMLRYGEINNHQLLAVELLPSGLLLAAWREVFMRTMLQGRAIDLPA